VDNLRWAKASIRGIDRTRAVQSDVKVRTFVENDRAELRDLFRRAGEGAPTASLWGHEESEAAVYLTPYMDLEPDSLLVADVGGALTGYLTGCLDSTQFPTETQRIEQAIRKYRLMLRGKPAAFLARGIFDVAISAIRRVPTAAGFEDPRWPAHLHINVIPQVRGAGVGTALMNHWFDRIRQTGSKGCHLQTLVENPRAVHFFERMGLDKHGPTPLVPGLRDHGKRLHQQTMVWTP
jgi:ribosomal protein S18 acetylase RimI-like enzyme